MNVLYYYEQLRTLNLMDHFFFSFIHFFFVDAGRLTVNLKTPHPYLVFLFFSYVSQTNST